MGGAMAFGGGFESAGSSAAWKAAWAWSSIWRLWPSQTPKKKKGRTVAAAQSLARLGILTSGSQRKSCVATKKLRNAQTPNATNGTRILRTGKAENTAFCKPLTK